MQGDVLKMGMWTVDISMFMIPNALIGNGGSRKVPLASSRQSTIQDYYSPDEYQISLLRFRRYQKEQKGLD